MLEKPEWKIQLGRRRRGWEADVRKGISGK